ncbi:flavin reductase family protein [Agromyces protaetiae]|uniref:Flavin reductase family protein n=1 Tax=Agromyces protaetiae TaxID=2509455 RepID=A0A4P6FGB0_9MICO|nr:flavin reductase family protein [Agromyces protaetiae]
MPPGAARVSAPAHVVVEPSVLYVGTPAYLIATENPDGTPNLAPASSYWALGRMLVLGIEVDGQTAANLLVRPGITVNFPSSDLWQAVARLGALTGRDPVPDAKAARYRYEKDKFEASGLTPEASDLVRPPRVAECRLQFEATVRRTTEGLDGGYLMVEAEVVRVHADPAILDPTGEHIDPTRWNPLVYAFRHFFERGVEVGWLASSPTAPHAPVLDGP